MSHYITIATDRTIETVFNEKIFADSNEYLKNVEEGSRFILIVKYYKEKDFRIMGVYEAEKRGYEDFNNAIFGKDNNNKAKFPYRVKFKETDIKFDVRLSLIKDRYPEVASKIISFYRYPEKRTISEKEEFNEIVNACLFKPGRGITFDSIAGLENLKNYIRRKIRFRGSRGSLSKQEWEKWQKLVEKLDHNPKYGILLFGPPGTGKTLFSKALANEIDGKYFEIRAHDISGYPGEAEKKIENIFNEELLLSERGVLFIDEAEWILRKREEQTSSVMQRVTPTLLSQWSRIFEYEFNKKLIFIIMTTNQPEIIDEAFLRPGRFDAVFYVPLPNEQQVKQIIEKNLKQYFKDNNNNEFDKILNEEILPKLSSNIYDNKKTADEYYCGADIYQLCKVTKEIAIFNRKEKIEKDHIIEALGEIKPSISKEVVSKMEEFKKRIKYVKDAN